MSNYWDHSFQKHIENENLKIIFEVGARYGDESIQLSNKYKNAKVYSFECNPNTMHICKNKLDPYPNIIFQPLGLGNEEKQLPFFSYIKSNDGASSLLKRIDFQHTQKQTGIINITTISKFVQEKNIDTIDLLCMDVQGYELFVLKGAKDFLKNIRYIIMEEPKPIINLKYLPRGIHSKYVGAPSSQEISFYLKENNFIEIERVGENEIEDNVMYKNKNYKQN